MRIVITGATGFIGSNLAKLFLEKGAEVFALVRPESSHLEALPKDEKLHMVSMRCLYCFLRSSAIVVEYPPARIKSR